MIPPFSHWVSPVILAALAAFAVFLMRRRHRTEPQAEAWTAADEEWYRLACAVEGGRP